MKFEIFLDKVINKFNLYVYFLYLFYFRGVVRFDVGVVISWDFWFGWWWCWFVVIFVWVCEVESKYIFGVFDWCVEISGR